MASIPVRPMLASLRQHPLIVFLLALQVAVTCAVGCNVVFMIAQRIAAVRIDSGVDEAGLSVLASETIDRHENMAVRRAADLAALRRVPGVTAVAAADSVPLGRDETSLAACAGLADFARVRNFAAIDQVAHCAQPAALGGTVDERAVLGLSLVEGRDFRPDEFVHTGVPPVVIISRALARRLYPGKDALGQTLVTGDKQPIRVVGVVDTVVRPRLNRLGMDQQVLLWPLLGDDAQVLYLLRSAPSDRQRVLRNAAAALMALDPQRIIDPAQTRTFTQLRQAYFRHDTDMIGLLLVAVIALVFVAMLGIAGLANVWVQRRRRVIGIRRAVGATRQDILHYFQVENLLIVLLGVLPGLVLAVVLDLLLMQHGASRRLPMVYLPAAAVAMLLLGQLAVLAPARRAAAVPPVVATRGG